jgi:hypothetical protein
LKAKRRIGMSEEEKRYYENIIKVLREIRQDIKELNDKLEV